MKKFSYIICLIFLVVPSLSCNQKTEFIQAESGQNIPTDFSIGSCVLDMVYADSALWIGTSGVVRCDLEDGTISKYSGKEGPGSESNRKITVDSNGNIWCTCYVSGVSRFDGTNWQHFTVDDGLISNQTIAIAADDKGGVWVSAYWGVSYYDGKEWSAVTDVPDDAFVTGGDNPNNPDATFIENIDINAADVILVDSRNMAWFTCRGGGITVFSNKEWHYFENEIAPGFSTAITEGKDSIIWIGSSKGLTRYDGNDFEIFSFDRNENIIPRPFIQDIMEDKQGNIWIAAYGGGCIVYDGSEWATYNTEDGLPDMNCDILFMDGDGTVGVTTDNGVACFNGSNWELLTEEDGLPKGMVRAVATDDKGNVWLGSDKGEISRLTR